MDVALAIEALVPAAEYGGSTTANDKTCFTALRWEDGRKKPSWKEIQVAWAELEPTLPDPAHEAKITARMDKNARDLAVEQLKTEGELPPDYKELASV